MRLYSVGSDKELNGGVKESFNFFEGAK